jgi:hypothetical protein
MAQRLLTQNRVGIRTSNMSKRVRENIAGRTVALLLLTAGAVVGGQTKSYTPEPHASTDRPLLKIDLRKYGYEPYWSGVLDPLSLAFTEDNGVLVAWSKFDDPHADRKINTSTPVPSHLSALILDTSSGKIERSGQWPSSYFDATIGPLGKQSFAACLGDRIQLLSNEFGVIQSQVLSPPNTCNEIRMSPRRELFSVQTRAGSSLLDARTFRPIAAWSSEEVFNVHFTDSLLVGLCKPDFGLCLRKIDEPWHPFHPDGIGQHINTFRTRGPIFVNDSTLAIVDLQEMSVVTLDGVLLFRVDLPKKFSFSRVATSVGGDKFACIETRMRGSAALDMEFVADDHIVVYDLHEKRATYTHKLNGGSPWIPPFMEHRSRVALSHDSSLLAILDDGILEVYKVPAE